MKRLSIVVVMLLAIQLLTTIPTFAQQASWTSEFFDNPYLIGPAKVTLRSNTIAYNWGTGSPGSEIPADNFSGRLATDVRFPAGTYRFWILADDAVHLYIDFQSYINTWDNPRAGELLSVDVTLSDNNHHIQIDYKEITGSAYIYVAWANLATNPTGPNFPVPTPVTPPTTGAWTAEYFNNTTLSGSPTAVVSEASPSHNWGSGAPIANVGADNFSVRWTSSQYFDGQPYRITVRADDGVRVYVDNVLYIDQWHTATGQTYTANLQPSVGNHTVRVEFYEGGGLAFIDFNLERVATQPPTSGNWTAEYFNNTTLSGSPSAIITEASPTHNWGVGAPFTNISADNFSVRWTSSLYFDGQPYRITVRADDGVRVYVDNVLYINEWHDARAQTYTADLQPTAGNHTVRVEYYEASGVAFIEFSLDRITSQPPVTTSARLTVNTGALNVRNAPNPITGAILTKIYFGDSYPIIGRNSNASWWQVNVNGVIGWVSARYVVAANTQNVPVTTGNQTTPPATVYSLTTTANLNMRSLPAASSNRVGLIPRGGSAFIVARNNTNTWWKVTYSDTTGWVSGAFVILPSNIDFNRVPIADQ